MGACQTVEMCRTNLYCCAGDDNKVSSSSATIVADKPKIRYSLDCMTPKKEEYERSECIKWLRDRIKLEIDMQKFSDVKRESEIRNSKSGKSVV